MIDSSLEALSRRGQERNLQLEAFLRSKIRNRHEDFVSSILFDTSSAQSYLESAESVRARLLESLGGWPERSAEVSARMEHLGEMKSGHLYRVHVSVYDDVELPALMLVPHAAQARSRPAVICLHGYAGSPEWMLGFDTAGEFNYTNAVGDRLASAGYVVIAPHIVCSYPGVGQDRVRLDRLARLAGWSLLGLECFQLSRLVDWLQTRPEVLGDRIGMYGISQGGQSTLFVAALDTRIQAAVCSCYFNNRWNKLLEDAYLARESTRERLVYASYLTTMEDDKFNPLAAPLWDDHVVASLICPRPFAVEIGRNDPVIYFRDALEEFGRLKRTYQTLGIEDRTEAILSEVGGHEMFYDAARLFLDRWLIGDAC